jgi:hypothetical protein
MSPATGQPQAGIVARTYLEAGRPVVVLLRWGTRVGGYTGPAGGPRNVRIRREDGSTAIRPFRGIRRPKAGR